MDGDSQRADVLGPPQKKRLQATAKKDNEIVKKALEETKRQLAATKTPETLIPRKRVRFDVSDEENKEEVSEEGSDGLGLRQLTGHPLRAVPDKEIEDLKLTMDKANSYLEEQREITISKHQELKAVTQSKNVKRREMRWTPTVALRGSLMRMTRSLAV
ncbi:MAG: hypothetical protein Q9226_004278 [Calogaya cf. arnoldii]